jgi:hypothetical protein
MKLARSLISNLFIKKPTNLFDIYFRIFRKGYVPEPIAEPSQNR